MNTAALSVARANGKTALTAGIAAATLNGPLVVPQGETVIVASSFEQVRIAFEHVRAFMEPTLAEDRKRRVPTAGGGFGTRLSRPGSRTAGLVLGCVVLGLIRVGRMAWRRCWCWLTNQRSGL